MRDAEDDCERWSRVSVMSSGPTIPKPDHLNTERLLATYSASAKPHAQSSQRCYPVTASSLSAEQ